MEGKGKSSDLWQNHNRYDARVKARFRLTWTGARGDVDHKHVCPAGEGKVHGFCRCKVDKIYIRR